MSEANVETSAAKRPRRPRRRAAALAAAAAAPAHVIVLDPRARAHRRPLPGLAAAARLSAETAD
jgi:hypothetical protein